MATNTLYDIIDLINAAEIYSPHDVEGLLEDLPDFAPGTLAEVTTVDRCEHRWYSLGTVVFRLASGEFFGVRGPIMLKSEASCFGDLDIKCEAFEMEPVPSVTYRRRNGDIKCGDRVVINRTITPLAQEGDVCVVCEITSASGFPYVVRRLDDSATFAVRAGDIRTP